MIKKIWILRHGQTDFNLKGVVQGSGVDASLNETGRLQARSFFEQYRNEPFDKVYTSALKRTHETVKGFLDLGIPHQSLAALNEISWGNREGKAFTPEANAYYWDMLAAWQHGEVHRAIEGGESPIDVAKRLQMALPEIIGSPEKNILICMHGRAMRILLCLLLQYPLRCMDYFEHHNAGLYQVIHTGSMNRLALYNDTSHFALFPELT
jgi:probable phosphoglycerate mutase